MSTITITDSHAVASIETPARRPVPGRGLSFGGILRGEWIKLLSLRSIRWSIVVTLALSWGGAALMAWGMSGTEFATKEAMPQLLGQSATFGVIFTVLVIGVLGALSITSEYTSGLILSSLSAVPSRLRLFAAKAVVVLVLALVVGAVSIFGAAGIAAAFFGGDGFATLSEAEVLQSLAGATLYLALAALVAYGVGALLRSGAAAITVIVVLFFVVTIAAEIMMMTGWEWLPQVSQWLPANLGSTLSTWAITEPEYRGDVTYWGALGGLVAWAAAALVPAGILMQTRDAV